MFFKKSKIKKTRFFYQGLMLNSTSITNELFSLSINSKKNNILEVNKLINLLLKNPNFWQLCYYDLKKSVEINFLGELFFVFDNKTNIFNINFDLKFFQKLSNNISQGKFNFFVNQNKFNFITNI